MRHQTTLKPGLTDYRSAGFWLAVIGIAAILAAWILIGPLPQNLDYHQFADQRALGPLPHGLNVLSNLPFCLVGCWGLWVIARRRNRLQSQAAAWLAFAAGIALTGLGSSWYHLAPDNASLVWDRLPMTIAFMAFAVIVIGERVDASLASRLLPWMLLAGIASVAYWAWADDLWPYVLVQFGPILLLPVLIWRKPGPGTVWLWLTIGCYVLAKLLELVDMELLTVTQAFISGHSMKHVVAAIGGAMMILKLQRQ